jgi:hypothetical protein
VRDIKEITSFSLPCRRDEVRSDTDADVDVQSMDGEELVEEKETSTSLCFLAERRLADGIVTEGWEGSLGTEFAEPVHT